MTPGAERTHPGPRRPLRLGLLSYGIDAPYVPALLGLGAVGCLLAALVLGDGWLLIPAAFFFAQALVFLHASLRGKHAAWERLLGGLGLKGDERLLDLGCGRGAVLLAAARVLPGGEVQGVDLWRSVDQSGNREAVTRKNAERAGVADRLTLHTADITALPLPDDSFDIVTSSLAIHNLTSAEDRARALDEAMRVLRPGGKLVLVDIRHVRDYAQHLSGRGGENVEVRSLGPGCWYGGPWMATSVLTAFRASPLLARD